LAQAILCGLHVLILIASMGGEMDGDYEGGSSSGIDGKVQDYKFLGELKAFDDKKSSGLIGCEETQQLWGQDVYIHKSVMDTAHINVGDCLRFGVHLNARGQPQASLPVYKVGQDAQPIGVKEGENVIEVEAHASSDPAFLSALGQAIQDRSDQQNNNRKRKADDAWGGKGGKGAKGGKGFGGGKDGGYGGGYGGGYDDWGGGGYGMGMGMGMGGMGMGMGMGGKGGGKGGVDLFVGGVPSDATERELSHIFRQYAGFMSLRMVQKAQMLVFVTFATPAQAQFVAEALTGYVFDQNSRDQMCLTVQLSKGKGK